MLAKTQTAFFSHYYNVDADADSEIFKWPPVSISSFFEEYKPYTSIDISLYEKNENKFSSLFKKMSSFQKWILFPLNEYQNQRVDFH